MTALGVGLSGLSALGSLQVFADTIQLVEGFYSPGQNSKYPDGTLAWRNNNPGNLRYTSYYARNFGAEPGDGGYARFKDYATGRAALEHQIQLDAGRGLTIAQMMAKYAPSQDGNDPKSYAATIAKALGVSVDTPVISAISGQGSTAPELPADDEPDMSTAIAVLALASLGSLLLFSRD